MLTELITPAALRASLEAAEAQRALATRTLQDRVANEDEGQPRNGEGPRLLLQLDGDWVDPPSRHKGLTPVIGLSKLPVRYNPRPCGPISRDHGLRLSRSHEEVHEVPAQS